MSNQREIIKTDCALCVHSCGLNVHVDDGKIVYVQGMPEHPLSQGYLCPRGESLVDYVYAKDRLTHPLRKENGTWHKISWDKALDIISDKLEKIKEEFGPEALALYCGSVGVENIELSAFAQRFRGAYGTPNFLSVESFCYHALITARLLTFGRYLMEEPEKAKSIILWAHNPDQSYPTRTRRINEALEAGADIAVIDLRKTSFAPKGLFLRPHPETDCALALALIHVIIKEELYDKTFVKNWTVGFTELKEHVKNFTPQWAEDITGVSADKIQLLARTHARAESGCIIQGTCSFDQQENGLQTMRALAILQAITGNVNKPGSWVRVPFLKLSDLRLPVDKKPIGVENYPLFHEIWGRKYPYGHALAFPEAVLEERPYPIKALIVTGGNPAVTFPNVQILRKALKKLDFLVVMDVFMTETAQLADVVLPANTFLEKAGLAFTYAVDQGVPYLMLRKKAIDFAACWPEWKFWTELGKELGYHDFFPWKSAEEVTSHLLEPSGVSVEELEKNPSGLFYDQIVYGVYDGLFATPSRKVELYSQTLKDYGYDPLPVHKESRVSAKRNSSLKEQYPLVLLVGNRNIEFTHSQLHNIQSLREKAPEPLAELHPDTAKKYAVGDGKMINIETPKGSIKMKAKYNEAIGPEMVSIPKGWAKAMCNELTDYDVRDPIMGYPAMKNILCRINTVQHAN